ncbi:Flagellar basal-body rod protein FlgB [Moritella sp. JT01]|uniref:flagellar basal body rod protein FlgB n=1 Tax=Moritella sp. JT01 TaxID=756698 RepID=UPI000798B5AB|nr:flagellar basal body rod protein FlgB [Moritella sp. JT01]KXO14091.1 Flagellar basal-body rod protein FlgB [Moritella sp. JT01]
MAINFDNALGIHQYSVGVRERRAEVLASNIANADTPGFKARDLSFKDALASATQGSSFNLLKTSERHISGGRSMASDLQYRIPNQPDTGDGNTVDVQIERASFMQNSMEYQASLSFLSSKIQTMRKAIKGQ